MDRRLKNVLCAVSAGVCGSSAGLFGKIGMSVNEFFGSNDQALYTNLVRFIMLAMVVLANIGGWLMYTRSLRFGSTLVSTGISIASNYIFTALTGVLLFAESCSILWACGTLSVMIGVILMSI
ncbi:uncharacterized protein LOC100569459 [Acyrthosiphon pisum]|uniref:Uncharacterized protein n=1 Tax=Acyrthosiphon pisum TaxID=7029 RepID=A0A8R2D548_ACYPI|nr:uncharacterized protein LOC100569459 [Acyrthosiphon pisum]XP_029345491.1 uncharacterized protein LOC100569459 [Acyrthosiphon pisum]|eukprot:XP_016661970.1 PREDICTED: uncharacterized protein LOC100569459 [Acyrthosiphon pisum]